MEGPQPLPLNSLGGAGPCREASLSTDDPDELLITPRQPLIKNQFSPVNIKARISLPYEYSDIN